MKMRAATMGKRPGTLISVGIDVGTTTTQMVFSRLYLNSASGAGTMARPEIAGKEVLYRSRIHFTPLMDRQFIDAEAFSKLVAAEYTDAGCTPAQVDTGAVIITGETARKQNAEAVLDSIAGYAGSLVGATAGPLLEGILAGKGSGAASYSRKWASTVANVDIGGGTSNIAIFQNGLVIDACCLRIGGRLVEIAPQAQQITWIGDPLRQLLNRNNIRLRDGDRADLPALQSVTASMADILLEALNGTNDSGMLSALLTTAPLKQKYPLDAVMFSGGVSRFIYDHAGQCDRIDLGEPDPAAEPFCYGDIGPLLGAAVKEAIAVTGWRLVCPAETIRATVLGAGIHSLSLSGSTVYLGRGSLTALPLRNVPVIKPRIGNKMDYSDDLPGSIMELLTRHGDDGQALAVAIHGPSSPTFRDVGALADALISGLRNYLAAGRTLIIAVEQDFGLVLGQTVVAKMAAMDTKAADLICLDQVALDDGDYLDIGTPLSQAGTVPLVIKTLAF